MAAWNTKHSAIIITMLAFLAPTVSCYGGGGGGGALIRFPILCSGGWACPVPKTPADVVSSLLGHLITMKCPAGSSETPLPPSRPSPSPYKPAPPSGEGLFSDYYNSRYSNYACPKAEAIVRKVVEDEIAKQGYGVGAGIIRLHFHDCFVDGCDGSVLLTSTASGNKDTEREGRPNKDSLRGFDVIDKAKDALEKDAACSGKVSCADILAFAARDAARSLSYGRINYMVPAGRYDGRESFANHTGTLPGPFSDLDTLKARFADQGLNAADLVLLSGAHSIGKARCIFISSRTGMNNPTLAADLKRQCGSNPRVNRVNQDYVTPDVLDIQYYNNVVNSDALFDSDAALTDSAETKTLVQTYKDNSVKWEKDFGEAMAKMGKIKIKTKGSKGAEIRRQCWTYNAPPPKY